MKPDRSHQLDLLIGGSSAPSMGKRSRKANKKRPAISAPALPLKERRYLPIAGVPKTRGDCPDTTVSPCAHVMCRFHLWRVDAADRAGRPGLSNVPRDERGHTLSTRGQAGAQRPETTFWPAWLELERTCKVVLVRDENGQAQNVDTYEGWETFRNHTLDGEPLEVLNDEGKLCGAAELVVEGVKFRALMGSPYVVTLRRVRGVPSCALDEIDKHGRMTNEQIGQATGRHRTLVARIVKRAGAKVQRMGVDLRDAMDGQ